jgi:hypothetical protein
MSMMSYRSGTSTSSSSIDESRRNSGQPSTPTSASTSKRTGGNHMSHWREAPRPNQHTVTHSEPIANPHHRHHHSQGFSSQQYPQQHQHQHHHSSSSYTGKKNFAAIDWKTETEITVTLEPIHQAMGLIRSAVGSRKISHLQPSTACAISAIRSFLYWQRSERRSSPTWPNWSRWPEALVSLTPRNSGNRRVTDWKNLKRPSLRVC